MQELINRYIYIYKISEIFFERYFKENAENRFGIQLSKFMWYKTGKFINPMKKNAVLSDFIKEEIENFYNKNELNIPFLEFSITTKCTLNCTDCCALIPPFAQKGHINLSFAKFKKQLDAVCAVANIRLLNFLGGEPLINSELPEMVDYAAKKENISAIRIITNGTMMPSKKLLEAISDNSKRIYFYLSNYSANPELTSLLKYEQLKNVLHENNIKFQMVDSWNWLKEKGMAKKASSDEQTKERMKNCYRIKCTQILNGKLGICSKALGARELGLLKDDSFIDVLNSKDLKQELINFYQQEVIAACKYCIISDEQVQPALQA